MIQCKLSKKVHMKKMQHVVLCRLKEEDINDIN